MFVIVRSVFAVGVLLSHLPHVICKLGELGPAFSASGDCDED